MDTLINLHLVKTLREQRSWSQDQLASIACISLRTVQRIEKDGAGSLESKKALASAFGIDAVDLDVDRRAVDRAVGSRRGLAYGFAGAAIGLIGAYAGITVGLVNGEMSTGEAGMLYGGVAAFVGVCCAVLGFLHKKQRHG